MAWVVWRVWGGCGGVQVGGGKVGRGAGDMCRAIRRLQPRPSRWNGWVETPFPTPEVLVPLMLRFVVLMVAHTNVSVSCLGPFHDTRVLTSVHIQTHAPAAAAPSRPRHRDAA